MRKADLFPCGIATMTLDVQCGQRLSWSWELTMTTTQQSATQEEWGEEEGYGGCKGEGSQASKVRGELRINFETN
jgi:hypothetical protein